MEKKNAAPLLRLVPRKAVEQKPCKTTIESLLYLLQEATSGRLKGLAYGAILADKHYFFETTGGANADPLFTLGVLDMLAHDLRDKVLDSSQ